MTRKQLAQNYFEWIKRYTSDSWPGWNEFNLYEDFLNDDEQQNLIADIDEQGVRETESGDLVSEEGTYESWKELALYYLKEHARELFTHWLKEVK